MCNIGFTRNHDGEILVCVNDEVISQVKMCEGFELLEAYCVLKNLDNIKAMMNKGPERGGSFT